MTRALLRSFTAKLLAALILLILPLAAFYLALTLTTTKVHLQTIDQSLNLEVAAHIRDKYLNAGLFEAGAGAAAASILSVMELNPDAEIYLLDASGKILAHAAPSGKVRLSAISMAPIAAFLGKREELPIRGDDPRDPAHPKVFSAAQVVRDGQTFGYVYVVLGGEAYNSAAGMFRGNYIFRLSAMLLTGSVVVALSLGTLSFYRMTAPLRSLAQAVAAFEPGTPALNKLTALPRLQTDDEIGQLARSFEMMAERIAKQIEMLKAADAMRREFLVYISHDLKTPIASVQGYLETLQMKWEEMKAEQREHYLGSALKANSQTFQMIEAIFELARLEGPDAPLRYETFSVTELMQDIFQKLQLETETAKVTLAADWDAPNVYLSGDIGLIERALGNIIQNAIKFSETGGCVQLKAQAADRKVRISIANRGPVIEADETEKIFVPFYRGRKTRQTVRGNGIGLAIAKRIVELHNGAITVVSSERSGTVFTITLPG